MKAVTVVPLKKASAELSDIAEPHVKEGSVLVETLAVGVCGTDVDIANGEYGWSPPGHDRLVIGHESVGRIVEAPSGGGFSKGDLVVGIVRRPDPVPCFACAIGQWDACTNGKYTEHGIKELHGFMREYYRASPDALIKVDGSLGHLGVLLEPTSVVAKAWALIETVGAKNAWQPKTVVVVGAGPIGLLAALIAVQRGLEVHVVDRVTTGVKPEIVEKLGARYLTGSISEACKAPDIIIECTGVPKLVFDAMQAVGTDGVVCLTGVTPKSANFAIDGGTIARSMVLGNKIVVGSVNANRRHYEQGAKVLEATDPALLARLITRVVPIERFEAALDHGEDDIKVVVQIAPW
jgi:threonine dehydrogenase-like Zn-dependent dehydrogenase